MSVLTITILVPRHGLPPREEIWDKTDWYCPACGKQAMWEERDSDDYYAGTNYECSECGGSFDHPASGEVIHSADTSQRDARRAAIRKVEGR